MAHPADITKQVLNRLMKLELFTVSVPVEKGWLPYGVVPFDMKITGCTATVTLPALSEAEAKQKVEDYINGENDEDYH
ncbi:MAG: hypothetical protein ACOVLB_05935 [Candidatus Nanopelagicus sp.]